MMAQIYGSASNIIAWLGESGDERRDAAAHAFLQCLVADAEASKANQSRPDCRDVHGNAIAEVFALVHTWAQYKSGAEMTPERNRQTPSRM